MPTLREDLTRLTELLDSAYEAVDNAERLQDDIEGELSRASGDLFDAQNMLSIIEDIVEED